MMNAANLLFNTHTLDKYLAFGNDGNSGGRFGGMRKLLWTNPPEFVQG